MALLKHNNNSISNVTSFAQIPAGDMKLLSTATASSSASISFNSTYINTDYKIYKFEFINIDANIFEDLFAFNMSIDNGSNYNVTKTSTFFYAFHNEADNNTQLNYDGGADLAQSTGFQRISRDVGNASDESLSGYLYLFNPSSTTYVKHWISVMNSYKTDPATIQSFTAGYGNTTSAINAIRFQFSYGNIDAGQIKLYGIGAN